MRYVSKNGEQRLNARVELYYEHDKLMTTQQAVRLLVERKYLAHASRAYFFIQTSIRIVVLQRKVSIEISITLSHHRQHRFC